LRVRALVIDIILDFVFQIKLHFGRYSVFHASHQRLLKVLPFFRLNKRSLKCILNNPKIDLIHGMLEPDPAIRLTLSEIKKHPWMTQGNYVHNQIIEI